MIRDLLILFDSPSHAIRAEKLLHDAGFEAKMRAAPRKLAESCGLALGVGEDAIDGSLDLLGRMGVNVKGVYDPGIGNYR